MAHPGAYELNLKKLDFTIWVFLSEIPNRTNCFTHACGPVHRIIDSNEGCLKLPAMSMPELYHLQLSPLLLYPT